jgi:undecaprenyl diphosphate synthase
MVSLDHVAVIPDGNRRFAKKNGLVLGEAYFEGFKKAGDVIAWSLEAGIKTLTLWGLSGDNLSRSEAELKVLFSLMDEKISEFLTDGDFERRGVKVRFIGDLEKFPASLRDKFSELERRTQKGANLNLNVAFAYNGRDELVNACRAIVAKGEEISEKTLMDNLYVNEKIDLVIRTGKFSRLSGFMPLQCGYSELFFSDKLWPEFSKSDFKEAVEFFNSTQRNFGK